MLGANKLNGLACREAAGVKPFVACNKCTHTGRIQPTLASSSLSTAPIQRRHPVASNSNSQAGSRRPCRPVASGNGASASAVAGKSFAHFAVYTPLHAKQLHTALWGVQSSQGARTLLNCHGLAGTKVQLSGTLCRPPEISSFRGLYATSLSPGDAWPLWPLSAFLAPVLTAGRLSTRACKRRL